MRLAWGAGTVILAGVVAAVIATTGTSGCPAYPAFPNAGCTGVPDGTVLTHVTGNLEVTEDDAVVENVDVERCIVVSGSNVEIRFFRAKCVFMEFNSRAADLDSPPMFVHDGTLDCDNEANHAPADPRTAVNFRNYIARNLDISDCENAFDFSTDVEIRDNFVHDLWTSSDPDGPHTDGLQSTDGTDSEIVHNTIYSMRTGCHPPEGSDGSCNGTSSININNSANGPSSTNVIVSQNLIAGGTFTMYCPIVPTVDFEVTDNHFSTAYGPKVGEFGPAADCNTNETKSGNVIHETGLPVNFG